MLSLKKKLKKLVDSRSSSPVRSEENPENLADEDHVSSKQRSPRSPRGSGGSVRSSRDSVASEGSRGSLGRYAGAQLKKDSPRGIISTLKSEIGSPKSPSSRRGSVRLSLPPDTLTLHQKLNEGANVYVAKNLLGQKFIVKFVTDAKPDCVRKEVEFLSLLDDPAVPRIISHHPNGLRYTGPCRETIVLEYSEGTDLLEYVLENDRLPFSQTKNIFKMICLAVRYVHACGVYHRDLKPENIIYNPVNKTVRLIDWEFASYISRAAADGMSSTDMTACGSLHYVAPETFNSTYGIHFGPTNDIWSLGVILFGLLTKRLPFKGKTPAEILDSATNFEVDWPYYIELEGEHFPQIPIGAVDLIQRMLCRYTMRKNIEEIIEDEWLNSKEFRVDSFSD